MAKPKDPKVPNTISDREWTKLQRGAAEKIGGLIPTEDGKKLADTWTKQRDRKERS